MADEVKNEKIDTEAIIDKQNENEIEEASKKVHNAESRLADADERQEQAIAQADGVADQTIAKAEQLKQQQEGAAAEAQAADVVASGRMQSLSEIHAQVADEMQLGIDTVATYAQGLAQKAQVWGMQIEKGVSDLADSSNELWDTAMKGGTAGKIALGVGMITGAVNKSTMAKSATAAVGYSVCDAENELDPGVEAKNIDGLNSPEDVVIMVENASASEDGGNSDVDSSGESSTDKEEADKAMAGVDNGNTVAEKVIESDEEYQDPQQSKDEIDLQNPSNNDTMMDTIIKNIQEGEAEGKSASTVVSEIIEESSIGQMFESAEDIWNAAKEGDYAEVGDILQNMADNGNAGQSFAANIMLDAGSKLFQMRDEMDSKDASKSEGEVDLGLG